MIDLICANCGGAFRRPAHRIAHGRGVYCSRPCMYAAQSGPRVPHVALVCEACGSPFTLLPCQVRSKTGAGRYCSRACRDSHRHGRNHPGYITGRPVARGPNWQAQKRAAKVRDGRVCQECGTPEVAGAPLQVHHIRPYRTFGGDYLTANSLDNLVTLCPPCHRRADAAWQAAEREAA